MLTAQTLKAQYTLVMAGNKHKNINIKQSYSHKNCMFGTATQTKLNINQLFAFEMARNPDNSCGSCAIMSKSTQLWEMSKYK